MAIMGAVMLGGCELYFRDGPSGSADGGHGGADGGHGTRDAGRAPDAGRTPDAGRGDPAQLADRWLAFDSDRGSFNRDIYLVRGDGSDLRRLTTEPSVEKDPAFSHDGRWLAFASDRSGSMQIHMMDMATEQVTQLTFLDAGADQPSWHPSDGRIVFHSGPSIYMKAVASGVPSLIATGLDEFNAYEYPSLSRNATEVLFSRRNEINARTLDGGVQRYVVQNWTTTEETPALSPGGVLVAYAVGCNGLEVIAVTPFSSYAPDPCATQRVTPLSAGSARRPAWASNDALAFERSATSDGSMSTTVISATTAPGADPFDIVGPPGDHHAPSWAPVGFQPN
jgi:dipeptidyl aminopeptidase/acylaminoacyl peptidase